MMTINELVDQHLACKGPRGGPRSSAAFFGTHLNTYSKTSINCTPEGSWRAVLSRGTVSSKCIINANQQTGTPKNYRSSRNLHINPPHNHTFPRSKTLPSTAIRLAPDDTTSHSLHQCVVRGRDRSFTWLLRRRVYFLPKNALWYSSRNSCACALHLCRWL